MNRKQVGIIAEQVVVCDLLRQGYEVFTSVSDNSRVDVVPLNKKTGRIAKIQVKSTSTLTSNDSITFRIKKLVTLITLTQKKTLIILLLYMLLETK